MSTVSVPLPEDMLKEVKNLIKQGVEETVAGIIRKALKKYLEEEAVQIVLRASKEPSLKGDLDHLAKKL